MGSVHRERTLHKELCGYCVENQLEAEKRGRMEMPWKAIAIIYDGETMVAPTQEVAVEVTRRGQTVDITWRQNQQDLPGDG